MIENLEILCRCIEFDHVSESRQRSIFNSAIQQMEIGGSINLVPYTISVGHLSLQKTETSLQDGFNTLSFDVSNMNLRLSGALNNNYLREYFLILDRNNIKQFRKWYVEIIYNGKVELVGTINPDNITEKWDTTTDSEILDVQILDIQKEFKQFYSTKDLISPYDSLRGFINNGQISDLWVLPWAGDPRSEDSNGTAQNTLCTAKPLFSVLFPMNLNSEVISPAPGEQAWNNWYVNNIPQFFYWSAQGINNWILKTGYKRFWQEGYSVYDLLDKLCNAMGWVWSISRRPANLFRLYLNIVNRYSPLTTVSIDWSNVEDEYEIGYKLQTSDFEYIVIPDGHWNSNGFYHHAGNCFKIITKKFTPIVNESNFFDRNRTTGTPNGYQIRPWTPFGQHYTIENNKAQESFDWADVYYTALDPNWGTGRQVDRKFIKSNKIIYLDGGSHEKMKTVICTRDGHNYPATQMGEDDTDNLISGNCGSMLFKTEDFRTIAMTYNDYAQTDTFLNNYSKFLQSVNGQTIEIKVKGIYTNINSLYKFTNSSIEFFQNTVFQVKDIEIDFINETTVFNLVKIEV